MPIKMSQTMKRQKKTCYYCFTCHSHSASLGCVMLRVLGDSVHIIITQLENASRYKCMTE